MDDEQSGVARTHTPEAIPAAEAGEVLALLDRILASPQFVASAQLRAFLKYVVHEELAGRGDKIKAYTVAIDALGRAEDFDPATDPVIRVVANRLRKALDAYYAEAGAIGPIRIDLVKGNYRPVFHNTKAEQAPRATDRGPGADQAGVQTRPGRTYLLVIAVLALMLTATLGYIASHYLNDHQHMEIIDEVPPELAAPNSSTSRGDGPLEHVLRTQIPLSPRAHASIQGLTPYPPNLS